MPVTERSIHITEYDLKRLQGIIAVLKRKATPGDRDRLSRLDQELGRATVIPPEYAPRNIVTMNTRARVWFAETGTEMACTLVFPGEADYEKSRISILSQLGAALIGRKVGETVHFEAPAGLQEVRIEEILYQPEAEGNFSL